MENKIISVQQHHGLTVVQFSTSFKDTLEYVSGKKLLKTGEVVIEEVNEGGNVNLLFAINKSPYFVFFMDGDILIGAKQNRVLNTSILLKPNSKINLPVSCVERGRWSYRSKKFDSTNDYVAASKLRSSKSQQVKENLKSRHSHFADQSKVWYNVSYYMSTYGVDSQSEDFSDIYKEKKFEFDSIKENFQLDSNSNGAAFFLGSELESIDIFNSSSIYAEYFPSLINSVLFEIPKVRKESVASEQAQSIIEKILNDLPNYRRSNHPAVAAGKEARFEEEEIEGFELVFEEKPVHAALFDKKYSRT